MKPIFILIDSDSFIMAACCSPIEKDADGNKLELKENGEPNDGFNYNLDDAKLKYDHLIFKYLGMIEDMGVEYTEAIHFVEGSGNVRKALSTTYKASRKKRGQPPLRGDVTRYVLNQYTSHEATNVETDDCVAVTWYKYHDKYDLIVASPDKDLRQLPCIYFDTYHDRDDDKRMYKISKEESERFFWRQVLMGDSGDDVSGIHGIGEVKSKKIIPNSLSSSLMPRVVYREYLKYYGVGKARLEFFKAYSLMKLPKHGITYPRLEMFTLSSYRRGE